MSRIVKNINRGFSRGILILLLVAVSVACDQVAKSMITDQMVYHERIELLGDLLVITRVENTGAMLGIGQQLSGPLRIVFLIIIPFVFLAGVLTIVIAKSRISWIQAVSYSLIIGGGLGNLYDRAVFGAVTDFVHMDFGIVETGIFNLADLFISIGVLILTFDYMRKDRMKGMEVLSKHRTSEIV